MVSLSLAISHTIASANHLPPSRQGQALHKPRLPQVHQWTRPSTYAFFDFSLSPLSGFDVERSLAASSPDRKESRLITVAGDSQIQETPDDAGSNLKSEKRQSRKAGRKGSTSASGNSGHGFAVLAALKSQLGKGSLALDELEVASSATAKDMLERDVGHEGNSTVSEDEERGPFPTNISVLREDNELNSAKFPASSYPRVESLELKRKDNHRWPSDVGNQSNALHIGISNLPDQLAGQDILMTSTLNELERKYVHTDSAKTKKYGTIRGRETDNKTILRNIHDESDNTESSLSNDLCNEVASTESRGTRSLQGQDILLALQKAAFQKAKARRKNRSSAARVSKRNENTLPQETVDAMDVRPIVIRAEWALQIENLEKRVKQLKSNLV